MADTNARLFYKFFNIFLFFLNLLIKNNILCLKITYKLKYIYKYIFLQESLRLRGCTRKKLEQSLVFKFKLVEKTGFEPATPRSQT